MARRAEHSASQPNVITRAELEATHYASLYDVVLALRGQWLQARGPSTLLGRPVEDPGHRRRDQDGRRERAAHDEQRQRRTIAFVDPVTAAQRWGGSHAQGTIVVTMHADAAPDAEPHPK